MQGRGSRRGKATIRSPADLSDKEEAVPEDRFPTREMGRRCRAEANRIASRTPAAEWRHTSDTATRQQQGRTASCPTFTPYTDSCQQRRATMAGSPFQRRPPLGKTYASKAKAKATAALRPTSSPSALDRLLASDSSGDDTTREPARPVKRARKAEPGRDGKRRAGPAKTAAPVESNSTTTTTGDDTVWDEVIATTKKTTTAGRLRTSTRTSSTAGTSPAKRPSSPTASSPAKRTRSTPATKAVSARSAALRHAKNDSDSSLSSLSSLSSDEGAVDDDPLPPELPRRRSGADFGARNAAKPAPAMGKGKARETARQDDEDDSEELPPPTDHVPLAERLRRIASAQPRTGDTDKTARESAQSAAPSPPAERTRSTASPAKRPRNRSPAPLSASTTLPVASSARTPMTDAPPPPGRPASPAKDLSAIFSRFAPTATTSAVLPSTAAPGSSEGVLASSTRPASPVRPTLGLKRNSSVVGGMAAKRTGKSADDSGDLRTGAGAHCQIHILPCAPKLSGKLFRVSQVPMASVGRTRNRTSFRRPARWLTWPLLSRGLLRQSDLPLPSARLSLQPRPSPRLGVARRRRLRHPRVLSPAPPQVRS